MNERIAGSSCRNNHGYVYFVQYDATFMTLKFEIMRLRKRVDSVGRSSRDDDDDDDDDDDGVTYRDEIPYLQPRDDLCRSRGS